MKDNWIQGYYPQSKLQSKDKHGSMIGKVAIAILLAIALIVLLAPPKYHSGTVVQKEGQLPPIVSEYLLTYGWEVVENPKSPDPDGWYVLVQDGNAYTSHRLTAYQYEQVQIGATIVHVGPFTWWANP